MKPKVKQLFINLALSAAVFALCFVVLEGCLRIAGYGNLEVYQPDSLLYWRLKPNQNCFTKVDHKPVHINSHGTRGPEFPLKKEPNTVRILCLGDSRTFGWGLTEAESYCGRLERQLQERAGQKRRIEVINAGVNAWSYAQMNNFLRTTGISFEPDFVILAGANSWTQFSEKSSPEFVRQFMRKVVLKNILRRFAIYHYVVEVKLRDYYERYRTKFVAVDPAQDALFKDQQQKDPQEFFRRAIREICQYAIDRKVRPLLLCLPAQNALPPAPEGAESKNLKEVAASLHIPMIDMTPEITPKAASLYLDADPVHMNAAGNELIAARLVEILSKELKSWTN